MLALLLLSVIVVSIAQTKRGSVWVMELTPGTSPQAVARQLGLWYLHPLPFEGKNMHAFRDSGNHARHAQIAQMADAIPTAIEWHERQIPRQQSRRLAKNKRSEKRGDRFNDPLYLQQWHLQPSSLAGVHMHVQEAWSLLALSSSAGTQRTEAVIAIVDDGLQHAHPDLRQNYQPALSHDFNNEDPDPTPDRGDGHGTSASGVAAAGANNSVCGVGVCPMCQLAGLRLIGGPSSDYMEAMALSHMSDKIAIYSNSWGPADDGRTMEGPGRVTMTAFEQMVVRGRGGKGSIYVWAGGNGGASNDNGNYDGYANNRFTIAVGAIAHDGKRAYYSEPCACLMVTAPSSGQRGFGIVTTDLLGYDGYSTTDCTTDFGGTSSAAPAAAGAIGALLTKRPELTRRQVLYLLATTSDQPPTTRIGYGAADWTPKNARGVSHSHEYGWGLVNVGALLAAPVPVIGEEARYSSGRIDIPGNLRTLPDGPGSSGGYVHHFDMTRAPFDVVEYVEMRVWLTHARRGDMQITLSDQTGVTSILAQPHEDNHPGYNPSTGWTFGSARHWGQNAKGQWTLSVADAVRNGRTGSLVAIELILYGA